MGKGLEDCRSAFIGVWGSAESWGCDRSPLHSTPALMLDRTPTPRPPRKDRLRTSLDTI